MSNPSDFQRKVFNALGVMGLSLVTITRERNGTYTLNTSSLPKQTLYFVLRVNTFLKLGFLVLLSCGVFQDEFEFFERMAIGLWFLIIILMTTSERLWYRKYPFFEILTAWWKVEDRIYESLGRPDRFVKDLKGIAVSRVWFQGIIAIVGIAAVAVQYDADPKYCVFAFSIVKSDDVFLKWLFGAHEVIFLTHAWLVYGAVIYISSSLGAELTYSIETLQEVLEAFAEKDTTVRRSSKNRKRFSRGSSILSDNAILAEVRSIQVASRVRDTQYSPLSLVREYIHVNMVVTQLNQFAAYNFLYMHACSYIQMVSDVFQLIVILRIPEASIIDAMFFAEDMMVCCYMLFRCFKAMAFLHPSSESFIEKYRELLAKPGNLSFMTRTDRLVFSKMGANIHTTAFRLGPVRMRVGFVMQSIDVLIQYYICVALWK